jgi:hypothetical protein
MISVSVVRVMINVNRLIFLWRYGKMKKVICLVMLVSLVGWTAADNGFVGGVNGRWDNPSNWTLGVVPQDATTPPNSATPQWNNDAGIRNGNTALIDSATTATTYSLNIGLYGAVSGVNMTGGSLTVGNWGMNIGRGGDGNTGHTGSYGTFQMSGGILNADYINLPQQWGTSPIISGHWIMDGGIANANWLKLGGAGVGVGILDLNGGEINLNDWFDIAGTSSSMDVEAGVMNIHFLEEETGPTLEDKFNEIQGWIDAGYITAYDGTGVVGYSYDLGTEEISIYAVPEPATLSLLLVGGLFLRRKKS